MASVALTPVPRIQFFDINGKPLAGGKVFTYAAGTTNPQVTYTDSTGLVPAANPIILDAGGFASIWLGALVYKIVVQSSLNVTQYTVDGVSDIGQLLKVNSIIGNPAANAQQNISGPLSLGIYQIQAGYFLSNSANPAQSGSIRLANGDLFVFRNAANSGDIALSNDGPAAPANGNLADVLEWDGGGIQSASFVDLSAAPAQSGVVRVGNNVSALVARNAAGNADVVIALLDATNIAVLGGATGVKFIGPINANSQNILNAKFPVPANGNQISLLDVQGPGNAIVGTGADVALFTATAPIAPNTVAAGKGIRITVWTQHTNGSASVMYKLKFGVTTFESHAIAPQNTALLDMIVYEIFNNAGVQNSQYYVASGLENLSGNATSVPFMFNNTNAFDFTLAQTPSFAFNVAATDSVKPLFWKVELVF